MQDLCTTCVCQGCPFRGMAVACSQYKERS